MLRAHPAGPPGDRSPMPFVGSRHESRRRPSPRTSRTGLRRRRSSRAARKACRRPRWAVRPSTSGRDPVADRPPPPDRRSRRRTRSRAPALRRPGPRARSGRCSGRAPPRTGPPMGRRVPRSRRPVRRRGRTDTRGPARSCPAPAPLADAAWSARSGRPSLRERSPRSAGPGAAAPQPRSRPPLRRLPPPRSRTGTGAGGDWPRPVAERPRHAVPARPLVPKGQQEGPSWRALGAPRRAVRRVQSSFASRRSRSRRRARIRCTRTVAALVCSSELVSSAE